MTDAAHHNRAGQAAIPRIPTWPDRPGHAQSFPHSYLRVYFSSDYEVSPRIALRLIAEILDRYTPTLILAQAHFGSQAAFRRSELATDGSPL
jgi:hypothetical protein